MESYKYVDYNGLRVAWLDELDGGGRAFGQQNVNVVRAVCGRVGRAYEFCAGPGFIGFSLLGHGLCESLCLSDVNPKAVAAIAHTIEINNLQDRVSVYLSDGLDSIPAHEKWDLVVSNPPHFDGPQAGEFGLRACDPQWSIHRRFFADLRPHLTPHAHCLMQESYKGSSEQTFLPLLQGTGLEYVGSLMLRAETGGDAARTNGHSRTSQNGARQTITIRAGAEQGGAIASGGAEESDVQEAVPPLNFTYFFCVRVAHDELVWVHRNPVTDLDITVDESGAVVCRTSAAEPSADGASAEQQAPRLPLGAPYTLCLNPGTLGNSRPPSLARVTCLPTSAVSIVDGVSGRGVVDFG